MLTRGAVRTSGDKWFLGMQTINQAINKTANYQPK